MNPLLSINPSTGLKIRSYNQHSNVEIENLNNLNTENEINLIELINNYQTTLDRAIYQIRPDVITNYLYKLSQAFHSYYAETKILSSCCKSPSMTAANGAELDKIPSMHAPDRPRRPTR